jgi:hypothetical protein
MAALAEPAVRFFTQTVNKVKCHSRRTDLRSPAMGLVAALRRAARARGCPLPSIAVADALLDERRELTECATTCRAGIFTIPDVTKRPCVYAPLDHRTTS